MSKRIRLGFMGASGPSGAHARGLAETRGCELAAISEPNAERRAGFIKQLGRMKEYDDYRAMLKQADLDAVVIGLPTGMHFKSTCAALESGRHVICEKPPVTTALEMKKVAQLAKRKKLTYMFARQPRFTPEALAARKAVQKGRIGNVYHAEAGWFRARGIPWGVDGWFVNRAKGGGVLLDLGVHSIDDAWFVMGCPRPVEVLGGMHCAFAHLAPKGIEYTAEDCAVGMIRFENSATLHLTVTFALNTAGPNAAEATGPVNPEWGVVKVYGDKGGIDVRAGKLVIGRKNDVKVSPLAMPRKAVPVFTAQSREFIRAIRERDTPMNSADQAVMLMQMLGALRKSGDTGRAVRIK